MPIETIREETVSQQIKDKLQNTLARLDISRETLDAHKDNLSPESYEVLIQIYLTAEQIIHQLIDSDNTELSLGVYVDGTPIPFNMKIVTLNGETQSERLVAIVLSPGGDWKPFDESYRDGNAENYLRAIQKSRSNFPFGLPIPILIYYPSGMTTTLKDGTIFEWKEKYLYWVRELGSIGLILIGPKSHLLAGRNKLHFVHAADHLIRGIVPELENTLWNFKTYLDEILAIVAEINALSFLKPNKETESGSPFEQYTPSMLIQYWATLTPRHLKDLSFEYLSGKGIANFDTDFYTPRLPVALALFALLQTDFWYRGNHISSLMESVEHIINHIKQSNCIAHNLDDKYSELLLKIANINPESKTPEELELEIWKLIISQSFRSYCNEFIDKLTIEEIERFIISLTNGIMTYIFELRKQEPERTISLRDKRENIQRGPTLEFP